MALIIFSSIILLINLSIILIFIRSSYTDMEAMISTMGLSTLFGLCIGFLCWFYFQDQMLLATLIACLSSMLCGVLIGTKFNSRSQLEGLFSGLMAGLMAVMLAYMFHQQSNLVLMKLSILFLSGMTIFFVSRKKQLAYPYLIFACFYMQIIAVIFPLTH